MSAPARTFALVGPGRAGRAVATGLLSAGWVCNAVAGRDRAAPSVRDAAATLGAPAVDVFEAARNCEVVVLATPDDRIAGAAASVARGAAPGVLFVHLAGSLGLDVFDDVRSLRPDLRVGALHPPHGDPHPGTRCPPTGRWPVRSHR
ncbi:MAG: NAD(P)-binding domain-containing protein [Acidimicrobiia bacterium]|nr:NAD(P)-binding domain-containing protein [Acidimicrobiia bacterium]